MMIFDLFSSPNLWILVVICCLWIIPGPGLNRTSDDLRSVWIHRVSFARIMDGLGFRA